MNNDPTPEELITLTGPVKVGSSYLAFPLAVQPEEIERRRQPMLAVDLDPQPSAGMRLGLLDNTNLDAEAVMAAARRRLADRDAPS